MEYKWKQGPEVKTFVYLTTDFRFYSEFTKNLLKNFIKGIVKLFAMYKNPFSGNGYNEVKLGKEIIGVEILRNCCSKSGKK